MGKPKPETSFLPFAEHAQAYFDKGYSIIPEKPMKKLPEIKGWSDFSHRMPTQGELDSWKDLYAGSGLSVLCGKVSGIVALDIDEERKEILDIIMPMLPPSPVVKVGAKGETRFFKFNGEATDSLKFNGEMVIEVLSTGKKTHLPPSIHPNGTEYKYVSEDTLLSLDKSTLPILPPALLSHIGSKLRLAFPDLVDSGSSKFISGRNDALSSLCGSLIQEQVPLDEALKRLIQFDTENNDPPLFTDVEELRHGESFTNALVFYSNHLNSINTRRYRRNEFYEKPVTASSINAELKAEAKRLREGKQLGQVNQKRSRSQDQLPVQTAPKMCKCCGKPKRCK